MFQLLNHIFEKYFKLVFILGSFAHAIVMILDERILVNPLLFWVLFVIPIIITGPYVSKGVFGLSVIKSFRN